MSEQALMGKHRSPALPSKVETQVQRGKVGIPMPGCIPAPPQGMWGARGYRRSSGERAAAPKLRKQPVSGPGRSLSRGAGQVSHLKGAL